MRCMRSEIVPGLTAGISAKLLFKLVCRTVLRNWWMVVLRARDFLKVVEG